MSDFDLSLFHPCPLTYSGEWCGGTAALIPIKGGLGKVYECQRCHCQWDTNGNPITNDLERPA